MKFVVPIVLISVFIVLYLHKEFLGEVIYENMENITIRHIDQSLQFDAVCLSPEEQITLHSQSSWELSCVITGAGTRLIADVSEPFTSGETVLVPPGIPHCWYFNKDKTDRNGNIENITIVFHTDFLNNMQHCFPELSEVFSHLVALNHAVVLSGETREKIFSIMTRMKLEATEKRVLSFMEILLTLAEDRTGRVIMSAKQLKRSEIRLSQIQSYVNCNYANDITIDRIASHLGMNRTSFCSFFKRETGQTFTEFLNVYRLSAACDMLRCTEKQIGEVAVSVGVPDIPYFCRIFKKKYGMTPTEYRIRIKSTFSSSELQTC